MCDKFDGTDFNYEFDGKKYALTQQPYLDGASAYVAGCVDEDDNQYYMYWDILDCWLDENGEYNTECDDESNMCDWDKPVKIIAI